jgi:hypothetical protein
MLIRNLQVALPNNIVPALISAQTELRPTNEFWRGFQKGWAKFSGRVRLRPNRNRRTKFDVRGFALPANFARTSERWSENLWLAKLGRSFAKEET